MKQTISVYQFRDAFHDMNRGDNFSYEGLGVLFDYLERLEEDTGEEMELDVIAICCDFSEYENLDDFQSQNGDQYESIEDIEEVTSVIMIDDERFIAQNF